MNYLENGLVLALLSVICFFDVRKLRIPDIPVLGLLAVRAVFVIIIKPPWPEVLLQLITAAAILVSLLLLALICDRLLGKKTLGGGDIKLLTALALFSRRWQMLYVLAGFCVAALITIIIIRIVRKKWGPVPMAPAISLAAVAVFVLSDLNCLLVN